MDFVACWYNFHWCVGLILRVNELQLEDDVKFICPQPRMAHYYHFVTCLHEQDDICTVPQKQIICVIDSSTSPSGRIYKLFRLKSENN